MSTSRTAEHPINPVFIERWSPRAFTGETISLEQLNRLFEAARWAPSAYNAQPWRFVFARKGTPEWAVFVDLLLPFNQRWAVNAAALVFVLSKTSFQAPGKDQPAPFPSHAFDAGAAWANLALQAHHDGLATHAMGGFDAERTRSQLQIPADYAIQAAVAIGQQAPPSSLPEDLQARELPSQRQPLSQLAANGRFAF